MKVVCKYFQCGFYKLGESCRKQHVKEIFPIQSCTLSSCLKRPPKVCKYFLVQKSCKFGEHCSYKHTDNSNQKDISELLEKIFVLEKSIQLMTAQITELTYQIDKHEKSKENHFKCSYCPFTASASAVLKCHITMKHKNPSFSCKD